MSLTLHSACWVSDEAQVCVELQLQLGFKHVRACPLHPHRADLTRTSTLCIRYHQAFIPGHVEAIVDGTYTVKLGNRSVQAILPHTPPSDASTARSKSPSKRSREKVRHIWPRSAEMDVALQHAQKNGQMDDLPYLHSAAILHFVAAKFARNEIYSATGPILIALNPFKAMPDLFSPERAGSFRAFHADEVECGMAPAHVFGTAQAAYYLVTRMEQNASIVVCGESGAGKTESTRLMLQYLCTTPDQAAAEALATQIMQTQPILEALGNAATTRNKNSSRFGKWLRLHYDADANLRSASITQYLLERSRVATQPVHERNFHVFYLLLAGASTDLREQLRLDQAGIDEFAIIRGSTAGGVQQNPGDAADWHELVDALAALGITAAAQAGMLQLLAGLLHAGNIQIIDAEGSARVTQDAALNHTAILLGTTPEQLCAAFCTRKLSGAAATTVQLSQPQAKAARDALLKGMYCALFDSVTDRINSALGHDVATSHTWLGLLDIFGLEDMAVNGFEQLCINYANERLQLLFNNSVFEAERRLYAREAVPCPVFEVPDNSPCVQLFEGRHTGLFDLMNEECLLGARGNDLSLLHKALRANAMNPAMEPAGPSTRFRRSHEHFAIHHYAGCIVYTCEQLLEKNVDTLGMSQTEWLPSSTNQYIADSIAGQMHVESARQSLQTTVVQRFSSALSELVASIASTRALFVRCIKTNLAMVPSRVDRAFVAQQIERAGVPAALEARRRGYPTRLPAESLARRVDMILNTAKHPLPANKSQLTPEQVVKSLWSCGMVKAMGLSQADIAAGKSMVLLKQGVMAALDTEMRAVLRVSAIRVQAAWRRAVQVKAYKAAIAGTRRMQSLVRGMIARRHMAALMTLLGRRSSLSQVRLLAQRVQASMAELEGSVQLSPQLRDTEELITLRLQAAAAVESAGHPAYQTDASAVKLEHAVTILAKLPDAGDVQELAEQLERCNARATHAVQAAAHVREANELVQGMLQDAQAKVQQAASASMTEDLQQQLQLLEEEAHAVAVRSWTRLGYDEDIAAPLHELADRLSSSLAGINGQAEAIQSRWQAAGEAVSSFISASQLLHQLQDLFQDLQAAVNASAKSMPDFPPAQALQQTGYGLSLRVAALEQRQAKAASALEWIATHGHPQAPAYARALAHPRAEQRAMSGAADNGSDGETVLLSKAHFIMALQSVLADAQQLSSQAYSEAAMGQLCRELNQAAEELHGWCQVWQEVTRTATKITELQAAAREQVEAVIAQIAHLRTRAAQFMGADKARRLLVDRADLVTADPMLMRRACDIVVHAEESAISSDDALQALRELLRKDDDSGAARDEDLVPADMQMLYALDATVQSALQAVSHTFEADKLYSLQHTCQSLARRAAARVASARQASAAQRRQLLADRAARIPALYLQLEDVVQDALLVTCALAAQEERRQAVHAALLGTGSVTLPLMDHAAAEYVIDTAGRNALDDARVWHSVGQVLSQRPANDRTIKESGLREVWAAQLDIARCDWQYVVRCAAMNAAALAALRQQLDAAGQRIAARLDELREEEEARKRTRAAASTVVIKLRRSLRQPLAEHALGKSLISVASKRVLSRVHTAIEMLFQPSVLPQSAASIAAESYALDVMKQLHAELLGLAAWSGEGQDAMSALFHHARERVLSKEELEEDTDCEDGTASALAPPELLQEAQRLLRHVDSQPDMARGNATSLDIRDDPSGWYTLIQELHSSATALQTALFEASATVTAVLRGSVKIMQACEHAHRSMTSGGSTAIQATRAKLLCLQRIAAARVLQLARKVDTVHVPEATLMQAAHALSGAKLDRLAGITRDGRLLLKPDVHHMRHVVDIAVRHFRHVTPVLASQALQRTTGAVPQLSWRIPTERGPAFATWLHKLSSSVRWLAGEALCIVPHQLLNQQLLQAQKMLAGSMAQACVRSALRCTVLQSQQEEMGRRVTRVASTAWKWAARFWQLQTPADMARMELSWLAVCTQAAAMAWTTLLEYVMQPSADRITEVAAAADRWQAMLRRAGMGSPELAWTQCADALPQSTTANMAESCTMGLPALQRDLQNCYDAWAAGTQAPAMLSSSVQACIYHVWWCGSTDVNTRFSELLLDLESIGWQAPKPGSGELWASRLALCAVLCAAADNPAIPARALPSITAWASVLGSSVGALLLGWLDAALMFDAGDAKPASAAMQLRHVHKYFPHDKVLDLQVVQAVSEGKAGYMPRKHCIRDGRRLVLLLKTGMPELDARWGCAVVLAAWAAERMPGKLAAALPQPVQAVQQLSSWVDRAAREALTRQPAA